MKTTLLLIVVFALVTIQNAFAREPMAGEWGPVTNGLQMSIRIQDPAKTLTTNEPVYLVMVVTNFSVNASFIFSWSKYSFTYSVRSPSGKDKSFERTHKPYFGSSVFVGPKETAEFRCDLRAICTLDEIGTYAVIAKTEVLPRIETGKLGRRFEIVSNPLYVPVVLGR